MIKSKLIFGNRILTSNQKLNSRLLLLNLIKSASMSKLSTLISSKLDLSEEKVLPWIESSDLNKYKNLHWFDYSNSSYAFSADMGEEQKDKKIYEKVITINQNKEHPTDFSDIIFSGFVKGTNEIPDFYIHIGLIPQEYESSYNLESYTPEKKQESYLMFALSNLLEIDIDEEFIDNFENFYSKNLSKIKSMESMVSGFPKFLGKGRTGVAFDIGNNKVLKIFKDDKYSYSQAYYAKERLHSNPDLASTEAMIYDVGELGSFEGSIFYFYVVEKMQSVFRSTTPLERKDLSKVINFVANKINEDRANLENLRHFLYDTSVSKDVKAYVDYTVNRILPEVNSNFSDFISRFKSKFSLSDNFLSKFIEEIVFKFISGRLDLHIGNLGFSGEKLRYFDPSNEMIQENINTNFLEL